MVYLPTVHLPKKSQSNVDKYTIPYGKHKGTSTPYPNFNSLSQLQLPIPTSTPYPNFNSLSQPTNVSYFHPFICSNYSDLKRPTQNGVVVGEPMPWMALFQGNLGWWNIIIWPDSSHPVTKIRCYEKTLFLKIWQCDRLDHLILWVMSGAVPCANDE